MTDVLHTIKQWRAKEIAKLFLLRSDYNLYFDEQYQSPFDLLASVVDGVSVEFGLLISLSDVSDEELRRHLKSPRADDIASYDIPVLLMLIDEANESGRLAFVVMPKKQQLAIPSRFHFQSINAKSINQCLQQIISWSRTRNRRTA